MILPGSVAQGLANGVLWKCLLNKSTVAGAVVVLGSDSVD